MDTRLYPSGKQIIPTGWIETSPTGSDLVKVIRGNSTQKALSLVNLFKSFPDMAKLPFTETVYTTTGATISGVSCVALNSLTKLALKIAAPEVGWLLVIYQKDAGTAAHTVTLTSGTYNGTNKIATFNAQNKGLVLLGVTTTRFIVVANIGTVTFSGT